MPTKQRKSANDSLASKREAAQDPEIAPIPAHYHKYLTCPEALEQWEILVSCRAIDEWLEWELAQLAEYTMDTLVITELQRQVDADGYLFVHDNGNTGIHPLLNEIKSRKAHNLARIRAIGLTSSNAKSRQNGGRRGKASQGAKPEKKKGSVAPIGLVAR